jgi:hypothetical protein
MQMNHTRTRPERAVLWIVVAILLTIAFAVSIRRLVALATPSQDNVAELAALDVFFAEKSTLTRIHIFIGMCFALATPFQLSSRVRNRYPRFHRWLGRLLLCAGAVLVITAYGMVAVPVGGWIERSATIVFATFLLFALWKAWRYIRHRDVTHHREWMLRAIAILLGIATTRPVMGIFFATRILTGLTPSQFFGIAFWIGFTSTVLAAEWYIRATRKRAPPASAMSERLLQSFPPERPTR